MKLHHAAALVLCGWYLMLPPISKGGDPGNPSVKVGSDSITIDLGARISGAWEIESL
jgi:hypothetical protein